MTRRIPEVFQAVADPQISRFLEHFRAEDGPPALVDRIMVLGFIKRLHSEKNAAYGQAWKSRGELTSILANVARKIDRIAMFQTVGTTIEGESIVDTAVDLFVYLTKYRLFLLEQLPDLAKRLLPPAAPEPLSDHVENFNVLADRTQPIEAPDPAASEIQARLVADFDSLHDLAATCTAPVLERLRRATNMAELSFCYVLFLVEKWGLPTGAEDHQEN